MKYFFEIKINQKGKDSIPLIMNHLINKSHLAIVSCETDKIAIAFPSYGENLGDTLRFHGDLLDLNVFLEKFIFDKNLNKRLNITEITKCPKSSVYRSYFRVRPSKQNSKLNKGLKTGHITNEKEYLKKMFSEIIDLPFFHAKSSSTSQSYKFFIGMTQFHEINDSSSFNSFGLSREGFLPHF